jgi:hypothetical protein
VPNFDTGAREIKFEVKNGALVNKQNGQILKTNGEEIDFVITVNNELKIGYKHQTLSGGNEPILAAGQMRVDENGKILKISDATGHYRPAIDEIKGSKILELNTIGGYEKLLQGVKPKLDLTKTKIKIYLGADAPVETIKIKK